jgi:hypothetical protein
MLRRPGLTAHQLSVEFSAAMLIVERSAGTTIVTSPLQSETANFPRGCIAATARQSTKQTRRHQRCRTGGAMARVVCEEACICLARRAGITERLGRRKHHPERHCGSAAHRISEARAASPLWCELHEAASFFSSIAAHCGTVAPSSTHTTCCWRPECA